MTDDDPYVYPGTDVLRNKLDLRDHRPLEYAERNLVQVRIEQGTPPGRFDLAHLKAIHHHLFQDIYAWAGEIRTVEIKKDGSQFQFCRYIETGMADVSRRLRSSGFLQGLSQVDFAQKAGHIMGDVNYVHPFREGNGRTQLQYMKQLAEHAGHMVALENLDSVRWLEASRAAHHGEYLPMAAEIQRIIIDRGKA